MNIVWGMKILWIFVCVCVRGGGGHHKIGLYLGIISFLKVKAQNGGYFGGFLNLKKMGVLEVLFIFLGER